MATKSQQFAKNSLTQSLKIGFSLKIDRKQPQRPSEELLSLLSSHKELILPFIFFFGSSLLNINWAREIKISVFIGGTLLVITEEILFRRFIQNELERTFGIRYMWIIAGILFGLWHVPADFWGYQFLHKNSYLYSFGQLAMQIGGGLWACAVYKKTRSVYPLILFHWIGNNYHIHLFYTIKNLF